MAKEKGDRIIDAFKKGEIPFESTEIETRMTNEGKVSNTVTKKCHPCVNEMHDECEQRSCVIAVTLTTSATLRSSSSHNSTHDSKTSKDN